MLDISKYIKRIEVVCREFSLRRLDLVGSAARSDFRSDSDLDFLVTFDRDSELFRRYFELKERLEVIFNRTVDLIEERAVRNSYVKQTLMRDRVNLYGT